jgi:homopolymeric O-antigen transport system permease protein
VSDERAPAYELVIRPHAAISLGDLADLWRFRELLWMLAMRDVRVRYKQAAFGVAWALLQPVTQMIIFTALFNRMAGIRADVPVPYALFCFSGVVVWSLFSTGLSHASESLVANANVIGKVWFPRAVVPLATVLAALVDFVFAFLLLLLMTPLMGASLHASLFWCLPLALLAAACAFAFGLWTSAINIQFRDVRYALPFVLQLLIFVTPVFYPSSLVPARYHALLACNPMVAVVDGFRAALFGTPLPLEGLLLSLLTVLVVGAIGFLYFRRMEQTFADRV